VATKRGPNGQDVGSEERKAHALGESKGKEEREKKQEETGNFWPVSRRPYSLPECTDPTPAHSPTHVGQGSISGSFRLLASCGFGVTTMRTLSVHVYGVHSIGRRDS
jgi:hypothetical protein